jgi:hypothetical protein
MATIVNTTPPAADNGGSGAGILVATVLVLGALLLFFVYGLPMMRQNATPQAPQISVPDKIDVNVNGVNPSGQ